METSNYTMEELELIAKNVLLSRGGAFYPNPCEIRMTLVEKDGMKRELGVSSVLFAGSTGVLGGYYVGLTNGGTYRLTDEADKKKIFHEILRLNSKLVDHDIPLEKEALEERVRLRERNISFIARNGDITQKDLDMMAGYRNLMQKLREEVKENPVPLVGDTVEGAYYSGSYPFTAGVIDAAPGWSKEFSFCAEPYVPFVSFANNKTAVRLSVSGGPFFQVDAKDLEYVGEDVRYFCDWGHCGPCAAGALDFPVKVNRWRIRQGVDY